MGVLALFPILGKASNFSLLSMKYKIVLQAKAESTFGEVTGKVDDAKRAGLLGTMCAKQRS